MRPTKAIKVGPHEVAVVMVPPKLMVNEKGEKLNGEYDPDVPCIRFSRYMRLSKEQEILLHETLHACYYPNSEDEEAFVLAIAPVLLGVIQNNHEFIAYLQTIEPPRAPRARRARKAKPSPEQPPLLEAA